MDMTHEPIRIPAVAYAVVLVVGPIAIAALLGIDVREAIATAIAGIIAGGGVIARAESVRARTDSPATLTRHEAASQAELDQIAA